MQFLNFYEQRSEYVQRAGAVGARQDARRMILWCTLSSMSMIKVKSTSHSDTLTYRICMYCSQFRATHVNIEFRIFYLHDDSASNIVHSGYRTSDGVFRGK